MTLKELEIGKSAVIETVGGSGELRQHFLDMGMIHPFSQSTNSYALFEKHPIPYSDGKLLIGIKMPAALSFIFYSPCLPDFYPQCTVSFTFSIMRQYTRSCLKKAFCKIYITIY